MATNRSNFDGVAETGTPRDANHAFRERGAGEEPGDAVVDAIVRVRRADEAARGLQRDVQAACVAVSVTVEFIEWWNGNKRIHECKFIEGVPEEGDVAYTQEVIRCSKEPYTFKYSHPTDTITGIACVPMDNEIQSPEAKVIEGGIYCKSVTIRLTPVKKGKWACYITICTKGSAAKPDVKTGRADAPVSAVSASPAPAVAHYVVPQVWVLLLVIGLLFSFMCGWCLRNLT